MSGDWLSIDWQTATSALLDVGLAGLVGLLAWRLRQASQMPEEGAWDERERRLREIYESLRRLVAQAQEDARMLDARLAAQVAHAESSLRSAEAVIEAIRAPRVLRTTTTSAPVSDEVLAPLQVRPQAGATSVAERVHALAEEDLTAEEIARQVDLPIADVRFLMALGARGKSPVVEGVA